MTECPERPAIIPEMKISALLEAYPQLEETLIEITPAFAKLRNPVLRKTIGGLTDLRQAAEVGGVSLGKIIGKLRVAAGFEEEANGNEQSPQDGAGRPDWLDEANIVETLDAREMIEAGGHPLPQVMSAMKQLGSGKVFLLIAPFTPAPMIDRVRDAGNLAWTEQMGPQEFKTYFTRGE